MDDCIVDTCIKDSCILYSCIEVNKEVLIKFAWVTVWPSHGLDAAGTKEKVKQAEGRPTRSWDPEGPSSKNKHIALRCWCKSWWLTNKLLEECSFKFDVCKLVQIQIGILLDRKNFDQFQPVFNRWKLALNLALGVEGAEFSPALVAPYMSLAPSCTCH